MIERRFKYYIHNDTFSVFVDPESENEFIDLEYKHWVHRLQRSQLQLLASSEDEGLVLAGNYILCPCNNENAIRYAVAYGLTKENYVLVYVYDYEENRMENRMENAAKAAYDAYAQAVGGKTFDDKPMLHWESLPERIRSGWVAAAAAARIAVILIED